jgi:hypothetical protein
MRAILFASATVASRTGGLVAWIRPVALQVEPE